MKYDTMIFDFDGTIADTSDGITEAVNHTVKTLNMPRLSYEERLKFIGPPIMSTFMEHYKISVAQADRALGVYREYYSQKGLWQFCIYDGIEKLLEFLNDNGKEVLIATSKPEPYVLKMLEKKNLMKYFKAVLGVKLEEKLDSKEIVIQRALQCADNKNAVMIGDTKFDVCGARKNNLPTIAVLYGFGNKQEMLDLKPEYVAKTVEDIYKFL